MWKTLSQIQGNQKLQMKLRTCQLQTLISSLQPLLVLYVDIFLTPRHPEYLHRVDRHFTLKDVSPMFVKQELCKLKLSKATGLDGIPSRFLKDAPPEIAKQIAYLINLTTLTDIIPEEWKEPKVTPIFKSGEKDVYRPISVLPLISKIAMERTVQVQLVSS